MSLKRNIVANLLGRSLSMASVYVFVPFYVATLGVERYAIIAFYAILLTIGSLADIGLSATLSREAARTGGGIALRDLLATMERALLVAALAFAVAVILAADVVARHWLNGGTVMSTSDIAASLRLMALIIAPQLGISLYTAGLLGLERQVSANILQVVFVTVRGGLMIPLMYLYPSLDLFFGWQLAVTVAVFLVARVMLMRSMGFGAFSVGNAALATLRPIMAFAGGMFAITILAAINTQMDKLVVSKMFAIAEFGYYSLASTLAQLPYVAIGPLMVALLPRLTRMVEAGDEVAASRLFVRFSTIVAALSGGGALGLIVFAPEVLAVWLGADHVAPPTVALVRVLALGGLFLALATTPFYLGLAHGHNRTSIVSGVLTLVVALPMLIIGSARLGLLGAAWPWVFVSFSAFVVMVSVVMRRYFLGSLTEWLLTSTGVPVLICGATMMIARMVADGIDATPLVACGLAGVAGCIGMVIALGGEMGRLKSLPIARLLGLRR